MWEERAHRARRDIAALAAAGFGVGELHAAAIRVIADDVAADLACWATIDPETLVISMMTSGEMAIPAEYELLLAQAEYSADEPHTFADLARRGERPPVGPGEVRARAQRAPLAVRSEARVPATGERGAIVVVGPGGELRAATPAARQW